MKLPRDELRDALCAECALGLLRGAARRRLLKMADRDPDLRRRLARWEAMMPTERAGPALPRPSGSVWRGIRKELGLPGRLQLALGRIALWRDWAVAATAVLVFALVLGIPIRGESPMTPVRMAVLTSQNGEYLTWVRVDEARGTLSIGLKEPLAPPPEKSYELWFIPEGSKTPLSLGVQAALGGSLAVREDRRALLRGAGILAVSLEPKGGSPTGLPTGQVLFTAKLAAA